MVDEFTHLDNQGKARMVEINQKPDTSRRAVARGSIYMKANTLQKVKTNEMEKGDVLGVARVAAIMGTKRTGDLIPMCHPLMLTGIEVNFNFDEENCKIDIEVIVKTTGKTGVEMEALTGVSLAALTIYDMCKSIDKTMKIEHIRLAKKSGGQSGEIENE
ncbi:cyclic pyranopterin monophosphate synthase MoaC [Natranaerobius thermophilus]|uniref:Cyclic pyranopterin monophosphate synthase n=1 Tax=Natranaerobius thermophilus (strain ATCC BAA-1301 / DSM 18059 / JW/NM-WN-LF) TaxID=457570 RepID=MOAC_NATTJ|nr:cyclic pyranopterin monophosphate synthase MoaC [Natranaerobius thermophilus]B2A685.1 RecName: Full=Cyclic pyranopterin monophosphate synthase; AltName: Full=Molybdenum cofactor biosynthesis protein C [Natranaerobius thermophilus JW/NM-WN-LF]ACB84096.1 GTP cyclohydrolase subunit MoaC [Natranaerobius thermophilus JW/NM-WN-LF]